MGCSTAGASEARSAEAAIARTVRSAKMCATSNRMPCRWARAASRMLETESPPERKKSSSMPGSPPPTSSAQRLAMARSVGVSAGAEVRCPAVVSGRAARSTLPEFVSGRASNHTSSPGTW